MEGLDDTGGPPAAPVAHRRQMQTLPRALNVTDASNSGVNETCVHQQDDSTLAEASIA